MRSIVTEDGSKVLNERVNNFGKLLKLRERETIHKFMDKESANTLRHTPSVRDCCEFNQVKMRCGPQAHDFPLRCYDFNICSAFAAHPIAKVKIKGKSLRCVWKVVFATS